MLIPLGFLAASGAGVASDYELIATAFGTGSSGTITFSSIPQTYKHLQIRFVGKSNNQNVGGFLVQFNGITTGVYARNALNGAGASPGHSASANQTSIAFVDALSRPSPSNAHGAGVIDIIDYSSASKFKTLRSLHGISDDIGRIELTNGLWRSTAAMTSITISNPDISFTTTTRFSLYGIKG